MRKLRWFTFRTRGFGRLTGRINFEPGKLNLIYGRNEAGKSTLVAGLTSALYGMEFDKRRKAEPGSLPFADDYYPWRGEEFEVELELEFNERRLRILRDLEKRKLQVLEAGVSDVSREFLHARNKDTLGEALTGGLSVSGFLRSFLINQEQAALVSAPGDLVDRIQKVVTASPGDSTTRNAVDRLQHALDHVSFPHVAPNPVKTKTIRDRISRRLDELKQERGLLVQQRREQQDVIDEYEQKQRELEDVRKQIREVHKGYLLAQKEILEKRIHNVSHARHKLDELLAEREQLMLYNDFPVDMIKRFDALYERYQEAYEQGRQAEEKLQRMQEDLGRQSDHLGAFEGFRSIDLDNISEVTGLLQEWRKLDAQREQLARDFDKERERLVSEGIPPAKLERIREHRAKWPENAESDLEELQKENSAAEELLKSAEATWAEYDLSGRAFRLTPQVIAIVLVALLASVGAALEWQLLENAFLALLTSGAAILIVIVLGLTEHLPHRRQAAHARRQHREARTALERSEKALQEYVEALGEESVDTALDLLQDIRKYGGRGERFFESQAVFRNMQQQVKRISDALRPYLEETEYFKEEEEPTRGVIDGFLSRLQLYQRTLEEVRAAEQKRRSQHEQEERDKERVLEYWNRLKAMLDQVDIDIGDDVENAAELFHQQAEKALRLRDIDKEIHNLERDSEDEATILALRRRLDEQVRLISEIADVEAEEGGEEALKDRLDGLEARQRDLIQDISEDKARLSALTERGPRRQRQLDDEITYLSDALANLERQQRAYQRAIDEMEAVEQEVFRDAARLLNQRLEPVLAQVAPNWKNAIFDNGLKLQVTDEETGRKLEAEELERVLSTGARDALFLGARMALSDFLSGGSVDAPYVLDEPFAHLDDHRFETGMQLLIDRVKSGSQVLLMTCHGSRHKQWYESLDPELKDWVLQVELDEVEV